MEYRLPKYVTVAKYEDEPFIAFWVPSTVLQSTTLQTLSHHHVKTWSMRRGAPDITHCCYSYEITILNLKQFVILQPPCSLWIQVLLSAANLHITLVDQIQLRKKVST